MTTVVEVRDATVEFDGPPPTRLFQRRPKIEVLHAVSVSIDQGETVGLVGESGSGKSTLAKALLGIVPLTGGEVLWDGEPSADAKARRQQASAHAQMVFQDPYSALNPMMTVRDALTEVLKTRQGLDSNAARNEARHLMDAVSLPHSSLDRYPSEFSGGQRQRIVIARAIAARPRLLVCDEPLSALDVTTQGRMIALLGRLRAELNMAMLFIGHDLNVVRQMSDRMLVMYHGQILEQGPADEVFERPEHPYTRRLIASIPVADPEIQRTRRTERQRAQSTKEETHR